MRKHAVISVLALTVFASILSTVTHAAVPKKINGFTEGERLIYTRVVESFRKEDVQETKKQRDLLLRNYPKSVHLDNSYYMTGVLQFKTGQFAEAVRDFGMVTERFPNSNKRPAAMFAKAVTYERLGLKPQALRLWKQIVNEYPGSQESQRARMQLRIAATAAGDTRKR